MIQKPKKVALLIEGTRQIDRSLLKGIGKYARLWGPWSFYTGSINPIFKREIETRKNIINRIKKWKPDGVITRYPKLVKDLIQEGTPTVVAIYVDEPESKVPLIVLDHVEIANMAAKHLLSCGFQNLAYYGYSDKSWSQQRAEAFQKIIKEKGFTVSEYGRPFLKLKKSWEKEQETLAKWLVSLPKPVGLMACNDDCGLQIIDACKLAKLHIPEDIAILGVDNDQLACDLSDPPLSSIELNVERAGYDAATMLDKMMKNKIVETDEILVKPIRAVQRQTTNVYATSDKHIKMALKYIKNHSGELIQVDDVVNAIGVSRRTLEYKFRQNIKRSIHSIIRNFRTEYISRLLIETDMTLIDIAKKIGYTEAHNLSRQFKQETNISPDEFRKNFRKQVIR